MIWPFKSKPAPEVDLTNEAYERWLRSGRPQPVAWFLGLTGLEQEALAKIGDEYQQDICVGIGYAVLNPQAADAGLDAETNPASETALLRQMLESPATMGGITQRQQEADTETERATQNGKDVRRSFLGREPDEVPT